MRKLVLLFAALIAVSAVHAQQMKAFISHKAYCTHNNQPYIEFTFIVGGSSVTYAQDPKSGQWAADVEIQVDITRNDTMVKRFQYVLGSEKFADSARTGKPDFADIQNVTVPNGDLILNFRLRDLHADSTDITYIDAISVNFPNDRISSSRISLYKEMSAPESPGLYVKYGKNLPPLYYNFVPESQYALPFASEIYNTKTVLGAHKTLTAKCFIEEAETKLVALPNHIITKSMTTDDVLLVIDQFNVFKLASGNYNVVMELYDDHDSLLLVNKVFFQKSNPSIKLDISAYDNVDVEETFASKLTDRKVLEDYVRSLYPISSNMEREFFDQRMKLVQTDQLQRFFYSFWLARNPKNPEEAWNRYNKMVSYVQERFGSKQVKGYRTDRGRVYLQYGQPNEIREVPSDPVTVPYEIWHYYYLDDQSNVKFVFYDPSQIGNDYELLHSNKYGEPYDSNWKMRLVKNIQPQEDIYNPNPDKYYGGEIDENWRYH